MADINSYIEVCDGNENDAFVLASGEGSMDVVKLFLERGADVDTKRFDGGTPLMLASYAGETEIAKLLLEHGADVNAKDDIGYTALILTPVNGNTDTVRLLIEHGADVNAKDNHGKTTLMGASMIARSDIVKILLENGADVNAKDNEGNTALMILADTDELSFFVNESDNDYTETVRLLLQYGAEIEKINKNMINKVPILKALVRGKHLNRAKTILNKLNGTNLPRLPTAVQGKIGSFFSGTNGRNGVAYGPKKPGAGANHIGNQKRELEGIIGGTRKRRSRQCRKTRSRRL